MSAEPTDMVEIPRADLTALQAEVRRLRRELGRAEAKQRIVADSGPGDGSVTLSREELAEAWGIVE